MINFYDVDYVLEIRDSGWVKVVNLITPQNDDDALAIARGAEEHGARVILYKKIWDSK